MVGSDQLDVVVVGSGVAGLCAALVAARHGLRTRVVTGEQLGGHLVTVGTIEDFPGFPEGVAGFDLCPMMQEQAEGAGATLIAASAASVQPGEGGWIVELDNGARLSAPVVIAATGARIADLEIPGSERLRGRGVSECATCDGPLHRGQTVVVAGGGDSALLEALELAHHVGQVHVVFPEAEPTAQHAYTHRAVANERIVLHGQCLLTEIHGDDRVEAVTVHHTETGADERLSVTGVFGYAGLVPQTQMFESVLELDEQRRIPTDQRMQTQRPGLYAAGDIRSTFAGQAVAAAGEGAVAATNAAQYLHRASSEGRQR